jgi:hypothetical protein
VARGFSQAAGDLTGHDLDLEGQHGVGTTVNCTQCSAALVPPLPPGEIAGLPPGPTVSKLPFSKRLALRAGAAIATAPAMSPQSAAARIFPCVPI